MKRLLLCVVFLSLGVALGQNVSSTVKFALNDASGAPVPRATCTLTSRSTGAKLTSVTATDGAVSFLNVLAGSYDLSVEMAGFKRLEVKDIAVTSSEIRTLGSLTLLVGEVRDSVTVTAEASVLQLASAERSGQITTRQITDVPVKGRDISSLLRMVPGIVDTATTSQDTPGDVSTISINGNRSNQKNPTVDGITDLDSGSNGSLHYVPNLDTLAEVKVLTSNYQAEFGRSAGGSVTLITKSGSRDFHGSGYTYIRNESFNANSFFNNSTGTPKARYRYNISGYTVGGPVYIPKNLNTGRDKLFFFWSQEYVRQLQDSGTQFATMPTAIERQGDYSRSFDVNGALLIVKDPLTGQAFPGNTVPQNRISKLGQAMLNYFPLPNYTDPDPRLLYSRNYRVQQSGPNQKRNDVLKMDSNFWPSLQMYYRFAESMGDTTNPFGAGVFPSASISGRPGYGHVVHLTKIISPTLINEFSFGLSHNNLYTYFVDNSIVGRGKVGNPAKLFTTNQPYNDSSLAPNIAFGGQPANTVALSVGNLPFANWNDIWSFVDNVAKSWRSHNLKVGTYIERTGKFRDGNRNYRGAFSFARDTNNPFDSGNSFSNALLGNFSSYSEATDRINGSLWYWNAEFFVQDNWRVSKRLTIDVGLRVYHMPPMIDHDFTMSTWDPAFYNLKNAPVLYLPAKDASGRRVALNPVTGAFAPVPLIGQFVTGSGDPAVGAVVAGKNGYPSGLYTTGAVQMGPRFGFAFDVFGNGRTAMRGGFGMFKDRSIDASYTDVNPPLVYTPTAYYGSLDTYAQQGGAAIGPSNTFALYGYQKPQATMNFSFGIQHQIGKNAIEASYVGNLGRHLFEAINRNPLPMYARFEPANQDPTQPGKPLADQFLVPYRGYLQILELQRAFNSNYNALQMSGTRRTGRLAVGINYTWSKALGIGSTDKNTVSSYFSPRSRDYGPLTFSRPHSFVANYTYDLPKLGTRMGWKPAKWVFDEWQVSGVTTFQTGAPFTPGIATTDGQDITGSSDAARITVIGDASLSKGEKSFYRNFNTDAFARTPLRSFGNAGVNILYGPGVNTWDLSIGKQMPLGRDTRTLRFRAEMYNAWNHSQFSSLNTTARFDPSGKQTDPNFGAFTAARDPRRIQFSLRVAF